MGESSPPAPSTRAKSAPSKKLAVDSSRVSSSMVSPACSAASGGAMGAESRSRACLGFACPLARPAGLRLHFPAHHPYSPTQRASRRYISIHGDWPTSKGRTYMVLPTPVSTPVTRYRVKLRRRGRRPNRAQPHLRAVRVLPGSCSAVASARSRRRAGEEIPQRPRQRCRRAHPHPSFTRKGGFSALFMDQFDPDT